MTFTVPGALLLAVAVAAAYIDSRTFRIPNSLSAVTALLAVACWVAAGAPTAALWAAMVVFAMMYVLWDAGMMGGGDVKYVPSLVLAAASDPDPAAALIRAAVFAGVLFATAALWSLAARQKESPLAVGGALALLLAAMA